MCESDSDSTHSNIREPPRVFRGENSIKQNSASRLENRSDFPYTHFYFRERFPNALNAPSVRPIPTDDRKMHFPPRPLPLTDFRTDFPGFLEISTPYMPYLCVCISGESRLFALPSGLAMMFALRHLSENLLWNYHFKWLKLCRFSACWCWWWRFWLVAIYTMN